MKLFAHFCASSFCNCYVLGENGSALIIDPGNMEGGVIKCIEDNGYTLAGVLFTHGHPSHVNGLRTLMKIYQPTIYCFSPVILGFKTTPVRDAKTFSIGPFTVEVITVPGHSADSAVYRIDRMLFTGDALSAGLIGRTASIYAAGSQMTALRGKVLSLAGDFTVFPGHGPPTTLDAERLFNAGIHNYDELVTRRSRFRVDLDF